MIVKGYPKLNIKGKPMNPLNYFIDQDVVAYSYRTQNNPQPIVPISLPPSQPMLT